MHGAAKKLQIKMQMCKMLLVHFSFLGQLTPLFHRCIRVNLHSSAVWLGDGGAGTRCTLHCCRQGTYSQILSLGKCLEVITVRVSPGPGRARQRELREARSYLRFVLFFLLTDSMKVKVGRALVCACARSPGRRRIRRGAKNTCRDGERFWDRAIKKKKTKDRK